MIPDEAVEAANEAVFRKFNGMMRPALVKVVLEAAAPHLMAAASNTIAFQPGAIIKYRGKMGLSWLAWAGYDDYYNEVWYCQRRDSVNPSAPRAVSHAELLEEIGTIEDMMRGDNDGG